LVLQLIAIFPLMSLPISTMVYWVLPSIIPTFPERKDKLNIAMFPFIAVNDLLQV
jgi:hypothetical protein